MAITLPNIPNLKATANKTTPGSKTGAAIGGVKTPVNPFAQTTQVKAAAKVPGVSLNDQFTMGLPYNPSQIATTAQSSYNSDVANAQRLAQMGQPTGAQITADYAGRGAAANSVYQDLANHLAGIQQATVAQGNTASAGLGAQNSATAATAPHIDGAPPNPALPTAGVQAVLGAQTAAAGNYGGTLQAAALSSGTQANQRALNAGTVASTDGANNTARTLASLLSGLPTESAREGTMTDANSKVDAANLQTGLSVWQQLESNSQLDKQLGNKLKSQQESESAAKLLAGLNNRGAYSRAELAANTSTDNAAAGNRSREQIARDNAAARLAAAKAKSTTGAMSPSSRRQALNQAIKIINTTGGTTTTASTPLTYTVKIQALTASGKPNPLSQPTSVTIPAAEAKTWKPPTGYQALGTPAIAKTSSTKKTINKPGSYTKYNRAASYLKAQNWTPAEIKAALKQYHP